ncbi:hypothetical protein PIROE2DRAFT_3495 [Piromyces sp. E2]|nr:hypothetical protein PIROE2DRAFT_3495 [Piromyces sp. E2]|eukprot:OUM68796.1 hypothetical protein PIROE2DRAFT_3495 [Piromyces sp. E2]
MARLSSGKLPLVSEEVRKAGDFGYLCERRLYVYNLPIIALYPIPCGILIPIK